MTARLWVGCYTADAGGHGDGVHLVTIAADGTLDDLGLRIPARSPSYVVTHPRLPVIYAVQEIKGSVAAFVVTDNATPLGPPWPCGQQPCHLNVDPHGRFLLAACWGSGDVFVFRLDAEGHITGRSRATSALDPHGPGTRTPGADPDRHTGKARTSRAHATLVLPDGRVASTDLGYDLIRFWTVGDDQELIPDHEVTLAADTGPRHLVLHPDGRVLVNTEYTCEIVALKVTDTRAGSPYVQQASTRVVEDVEPDDTAAEIALAPDGRHAYVGIRGSDRIAVVTVADDRLDPTAVTASGGRTPRHHIVHEDLLHVAHEDSDEVTTFSLDPRTGTPGAIRDRLKIGSPTALVRGTMRRPNTTRNARSANRPS